MFRVSLCNVRPTRTGCPARRPQLQEAAPASGQQGLYSMERFFRDAHHLPCASAAALEHVQRQAGKNSHGLHLTGRQEE